MLFYMASVMADVKVGDTIPYFYEGDTLWYIVKTSSVTLTKPEKDQNNGHYYGTHTQPSGKVIVADSVEVNGKKLPVSGANGLVFYGLKGISEVIYQAPIASLGGSAFSYSSVTRITVPKTVKDFNNGTFQRTTNLDTIIFENLEVVPSSAWDTWINCGVFSSISNNFWRIENFIFGYSGNVPNNVLNIPEGVVGISSYMSRSAANATEVKAIVLPSTIKKFVRGA